MLFCNLKLGLVFRAGLSKARNLDDSPVTARVPDQAVTP